VGKGHLEGITELQGVKFLRPGESLTPKVEEHRKGGVKKDVKGDVKEGQDDIAKGHLEGFEELQGVKLLRPGESSTSEKEELGKGRDFLKRDKEGFKDVQKSDVKSEEKKVPFKKETPEDVKLGHLEGAQTLEGVKFLRPGESSSPFVGNLRKDDKETTISPEEKIYQKDDEKDIEKGHIEGLNELEGVKFLRPGAAQKSDVGGKVRESEGDVKKGHLEGAKELEGVKFLRPGETVEEGSRGNVRESEGEQGDSESKKFEGLQRSDIHEREFMDIQRANMEQFRLDSTSEAKESLGDDIKVDEKFKDPALNPLEAPQVDESYIPTGGEDNLTQSEKLISNTKPHQREDIGIKDDIGFDPLNEREGRNWESENVDARTRDGWEGRINKEKAAGLDVDQRSEKFPGMIGVGRKGGDDAQEAIGRTRVGGH